MKYYQYFFVVLRTLVILQTVLVLSGKFVTEPRIKLIIDSLIKLGIGSFLYFFFLLNEIPGLDPWDAFIIRFAGVVLMLNIDFGGYKDYKINGGVDKVAIAYTELIAPMIKAIQELTAKLDILESKYLELKS